MADAETSKPVDDPNFKVGVMSPNSKIKFSEMRFVNPVTFTQKLVLDEDTFELAFLKCSMCRERYNMADKSPRMLPCHHTFCLDCIKRFFKAETDYRSSLVPSGMNMNMEVAVPIMCPNCSETFLTSESGISELTTDHRIVQLVDFIGAMEKHEAAYCPNHAMQCLNFFCEACKQTVCRDCTVLDHKACVEAKQVLDIKAAKEKYVPVVEKGDKVMETEIESLKEKRGECEKILSTCQDGDQGLIDEIKESFEKLRTTLNEREKALLDQAKSKTGSGKGDVEEKIKRMTEKETEAAKIAETVKSFKDFDNLAKLHTYYEKIQNFETEPALDKDSIKTDAPKLKFICRDQETIVNRLEKYGELQTQEKAYNGTSSLGTAGSSYSSGGVGSTYGSYGSGYGSSRYTGSTLSSTSGSNYSSRYTPRSNYRYN